MPEFFNQLREDAQQMFLAGIAAADPGAAVKKHLRFEKGHIEIIEQSENQYITHRTQSRRIHVIAVGKAACQMAAAARQIIPDDYFVQPGMVISNYENAQQLNDFEVYGANHPLPDEAGLQAARKVADRIKQAEPNDLILLLLSGGGSALLPLPLPGISLEQKIAVTDLLLACGADINEINCVRKHLSQLKGGGLTKMAAPTPVYSLILSDVIGDDLSAIASGPTVADNTQFDDAIDILNKYQIWQKLPDSVKAILQSGQAGRIEETPNQNDPVFKTAKSALIGSNPISRQAVENKAEQLGYQIITYSDQLSGEARLTAEQLAEWLKQQARHLDAKTAIIAGGETTVTLQGKGKGGRNQETALAFLLAAEQLGLEKNWLLLSGGTDGRDGPTDAAGGIVDPYSIEKIENPAALLNNNDAYHALQQAGSLLKTGATGTNVADLLILLLHPTTENPLSQPGNINV